MTLYTLIITSTESGRVMDVIGSKDRDALWRTRFSHDYTNVVYTLVEVNDIGGRSFWNSERHVN